MKRIIYIYIILMLSLVGQKRDARSVAMAGATSTNADGIFAVGYNPGLIALQKDKPFMLQLGGMDFGLGNNYLSMAAMNTLSGDTLDSEEKTTIINRLQSRGGLTFNLNGQLSTPGINYSSGNMALTSNILYMSSYALPAGMIR